MNYIVKQFHMDNSIKLAIFADESIEFFTAYANLAEMALFVSKDLTTAKQTSGGARPDATDYYWFRSPMPNYINWHVLFRGSLNFCSCTT